MNARKPRRNMTFNPDQPRRAKQKCNEALLGGHLPSSKSSASSSTKASTKTSQVSYLHFGRVPVLNVNSDSLGFLFRVNLKAINL